MQKKILNFIKILGALILLIMLNACEKFLNEKQDNKFTTPQSLSDLRMVLDFYNLMNTNYPIQSEVAADNYYLTNADYNGISDNDIKFYHTWQKTDQRITDYSNMYRIVLAANTVLENADNLAQTPADVKWAKKLKAEAFFFRANTFYNLAQVFATPYTSVESPYGIPLRLTSDINAVTTRATVHQSYIRIISDLKAATAFLDNTAASPNRPTKPAAMAALARCYLAMSMYKEAGLYADSALLIKNELLNFNTLNALAAAPFARFNKEVIFPAISATATALAQARAKVDTSLYSSFQNNDLRRTLFFKQNSNGSFAFKGDYNAANNSSAFLGYTTGELYLVKAECQARQDQWQQAMQTLNELLITRWRTGTFTPFSAVSKADALEFILKERRKELCFRGQRWTDLRRLNLDPTTQTTLHRNLNNTTFTLAPNATAYTFQLPELVVQATGITQNP